MANTDNLTLESQAIEKAKKKTTRNVPSLSALTRTLMADKGLQEDTVRMRTMTTLANLFDKDLKVNLGLNAFELDEKYDTYSPHDWLEFKNLPAVRRYIEQYLNDMQAVKANEKLATAEINTTRDALSLQATIDEKKKADQNTNVIIFLMPQKEYKR